MYALNAFSCPYICIITHARVFVNRENKNFSATFFDKTLDKKKRKWYHNNIEISKHPLAKLKRVFA